MKYRRKTPPRIPNEEFGMEFGDVNGIKLFEFPFKSRKKGKEHQNKKESRS